MYTHPDTIHRANFGPHRNSKHTAAATGTAWVFVQSGSEAAHVA
jgi:hypothetical protein